MIEPYDHGVASHEYRAPDGSLSFGSEQQQIRAWVRTADHHEFQSDWEQVGTVPMVIEHRRDLPIPPSLVV